MTPEATVRPWRSRHAAAQHTAGEENSEISPKRGHRRVIASIGALASAGALTLGTVLPATSVLASGAQEAGTQPQALLTSAAAAPLSLPESVALAPVVPLPKQSAQGAQGATGAPARNQGFPVPRMQNFYGGLADTKLRYPFDSEVPLTDPFGYRSFPVAGFHDAQDMAAQRGAPIRITGNGVVAEAGFASDGCGFALSVQHKVNGQQILSRYCHMQDGSNSYRVGDTVKAGDQAGLVGETGLAFGAHLHLIIKLDEESIDPLPFIAQNAG